MARAKFDMGEFVKTMQGAPATMPAEERDIEVITAEIICLKQQTAQNILEIGHRLNEAKEKLPHGAWLPWLTERVEFTERTAQKYMRLAREWPNTKALSDLGLTKAFSLLTLPVEERDQFAEENNVIDMTSRELERAIRERDEARQGLEAAQADAKTAEESRAKMAADMAALAAIHRAAQEGEAQAREALEQAKAELQELREKPVEVAVETVVDEEAIQKARQEAIREMQAKVDKAEAARKEAEIQRKSAEIALKEAKKNTEASTAALSSRAEKAEAELVEVRRQLEETDRVEKRTAAAGAEELATFKLLFDQTKEAVNKLQGLLLKVRGRGDTELAEKLKAALLALSDAVRGCVE